VSAGVTPQQLKLAETLVDEARANGGLAPLDVEQFWADEEIAHADPFGRHIPQAALGIRMSAECVFDELDVEEDWYRLRHEPEYRARLSRRYNDKSEQIVGRRLLRETVPETKGRPPAVKGLHDIFEAENVWRNNSYWLEQSAETPDELSALLDRVEKRLENLRDFLLPDGWAKEKEHLETEGGKLPLYRNQRGPVTFAMSVYGLENMIFLIMDRPDLAARFRDLILRAMLERARIIDEEAGYTPETAPHGWGFADDNCAMLTPDMYQFFGLPILKGIFDRYGPDPGDRRGQHSDSDMAHIVPLLGRLNLTDTNFGPNVMVDHIRRHLPNAVIMGELAPFTFSRNEEVNIVAEFLRDFERVGDTRGLMFTTAGSINNGSRLTGMRLIMAAIQKHGRY
jgi:uroporphyrinogen decarboxylase